MQKTDKIITSGLGNKGKHCSVFNCVNESKCKTYCFKHYERFKKTGDPLKTPTGREHGKRSVCIIFDCKRIVEGFGYCRKHYDRIRTSGNPLKRTRFDKNEVVDLQDGISKISLYNKKGVEIACALVDSKYVEGVKRHKWAGVKKGKSIYVKTDTRVEGKRKTLYLANLIIGEKRGHQVDHISGDPLDNRRSNLRFVTQQQNLMNRVRAKGYSKEKASGLWHTYIDFSNKRIQLGRFKTEEEAKKVRRVAELKYFGDYAAKKD